MRAGLFDAGQATAASRHRDIVADAQFNTGRQEAPESTIGGQSTCINCLTNPKSHVEVPCGHHSASAARL